MRSVTFTSRLLPLAGACLTLGLLLVPLPVRAVADESVTASPQAESWYRSVATAGSAVPDTCDLPTGCTPGVPSPPVEPPSPYPAGFVHVGVSAGLEESRTYLAFDLSAVPFDAELVGGALTLPITTDPAAGVVLADAATVRACHVPGFVSDSAAGDLTGAPAIDCAISSPATFVAANGTDPAALTIDLSPFLEEWATGVGQLALVPQDGLAPSDSWHVAFSRRDRQAADAVAISARLDLATLAIDEPFAEDVPSSVELPEDDLEPLFIEEAFADPSFESETFAAQPVDRAAIEESAIAPAQAQPVVAVVGGRFAYPAIFLLPLAVAGAIAWAGRAFTRDLQAPVS